MSDTSTRYLIIGAGISGLAFANFIDSDDYLILERDDQIGGWCKTVHQDGFVWDYSGHFFHFRHPEIEAYLRERMPQDEVATINRSSKILYKGSWLDFPFQKNIHQLPQDEFIECLYDLFFRQPPAPNQQQSFKAMLYEKFGRGISEKFLIPYNEKLYACDLDTLDRDAMGRFFPHADLADIIKNMRQADNSSYNSTFTYPKNGAIMYVNALYNELNPERVLMQEGLVSIDLAKKVALTTKGRSIRFEHLISSAPFDHLIKMASLPHNPPDFTYNKVLVFNLGFDRKGPRDVHWAYIPDKDCVFYRVGFYDNIFDDERMSLYIEIGAQAHETLNAQDYLPRVLEDLKKLGLVTDQQLISHHSVVLDPAYVHITARSKAAFEELSKTLSVQGVHTIGRYGGWTYCSIEDNILEARALAARLNSIYASNSSALKQ